MKIKLKSNLLLLKKHKQTQLKADIVLAEDNEDRKLITGEIVQGNNQFKEGDTIIFGKYALLKLTIKGEDFYIIDEEDVLGTTDYKE